MEQICYRRRERNTALTSSHLQKKVQLNPQNEFQLWWVTSLDFALSVGKGFKLLSELILQLFERKNWISFIPPSIPISFFWAPIRFLWFYCVDIKKN